MITVLGWEGELLRFDRRARDPANLFGGAHRFECVCDTMHRAPAAQAVACTPAALGTAYQPPRVAGPAIVSPSFDSPPLYRNPRPKLLALDSPISPFLLRFSRFSDPNHPLSFEPAHSCKYL